MIECHVYQVLSKKMIVGVLEKGCVAEIDLREGMDEDTFTKLAMLCNCFSPTLVALNDHIHWSSQKKRLQCLKLEFIVG